MKNKIIQIVVATLLLVAAGSTPIMADGGLPPLRFPGDKNCPNGAIPSFDSGGPVPFCFPGDKNCPSN